MKTNRSIYINRTSCIRKKKLMDQFKLFLGDYGLHLPEKRGYKEQSLTVNLSHNQARIRSVPRP